MPRYMILCFGSLFLAFYVLSGGTDFEAGPHTTARALGLAGPDHSAKKLHEGAAVGQTTADVAGSATPVSDPGITLATLDPQVKDVSSAPGPMPQDATPADVRETAGPRSAPREAAELVGTGATAVDPRRVNGSRVNLRAGPGTANAVRTRLDKGDLVEVLEDSGDGWLKVRVPGTGVVGWMADFLVTAATD